MKVENVNNLSLVRKAMKSKNFVGTPFLTREFRDDAANKIFMKRTNQIAMLPAFLLAKDGGVRYPGTVLSITRC
jgi:hypothetical protein